MKQYSVSPRAFTLVELLVVVTILAIISITAYTSFSGATDKAKNSTKMNHISAIETGLNAFYSEKNYYPMPSAYSATNVWGYSGTVAASLSNTFSGIINNNQIESIATAAGGGMVFMSGASTSTGQIGAKGTLDSDVLAKQYISNELADPALKDTKVGNDKTLKDYGIGEYVYGVYAKNNSAWDATSKKGSAYNVAIVVSDEQKGAITKISGNFDKSTCINCPNTLIGSGTSNDNLRDGESYTGASTTDANARVAYPISGF
ncbi:MAG: type II secretion system protein [Candidatus Gracilibacteria bacterium]|nr:type II secretion system protein [Candidatus Gracilibacteria bacterium]